MGSVIEFPVRAKFSRTHDALARQPEFRTTQQQANHIARQVEQEVEHAGRTGFCCLEASNNPRGGSLPIRTALDAALEQGLTRREPAG